MDDELRQLRSEVADLQAAFDALESPDVSGSFSLAAVTVSDGSYPSSGGPGKVFPVQAIDVTGAEVEGTAAVTATRDGIFYAANLLSGLPAVGTQVLISEVGGAFVFQF